MPDVDKSLFSGANLMFIIIYILIFVGLALQASGARMSRQVKFIRRVGRPDDPGAGQGSEGHTRQQLEERITLPHHTIFLQYFPLYILPIVIAVIAWFVIRLLGQLAGAA
ncbi:YniB family protein [Serratia ureilytica]